MNVKNNLHNKYVPILINFLFITTIIVLYKLANTHLFRNNVTIKRPTEIPQIKTRYQQMYSRSRYINCTELAIFISFVATTFCKKGLCELVQPEVFKPQFPVNLRNQRNLYI